MTPDRDPARLAKAIEQQNALKRLELLLELENRKSYPDGYDALIRTIEDMERDLL